MGDRLNFIIDHRLEPVRCDFADYNRFTHIHWIKYFLCPGRKFRSIWGFFLCPCVNGNNWFSYITLGKTYCQSSRRLYVSETSLPNGLVVYINLFIACFVQASDDRLLKMIIDNHNQQHLRLINRLFLIIGTSLPVTYQTTGAHNMPQHGLPGVSAGLIVSIIYSYWNNYLHTKLPVPITCLSMGCQASLLAWLLPFLSPDLSIEIKKQTIKLIYKF